MNYVQVIAIVGPTASGKTASGIEIAKKFDGEVICIDSRTVYKGMDIGTAKVQVCHPELAEGSLAQGGNRRRKFPTVNSGNLTTITDKVLGGSSSSIHQLFAGGRGVEVEGVVHWGLDLVEPNEEYTVTMFQRYVQQKIKDIHKRGKLPVLVGGTGLWMDAVLDNLSFPEVAPQAEIRAELEVRSLKSLGEEYGELDPKGAEQIDLQNKRRLIRAIEVCRVTGKPFSSLKEKGPKMYETLWLGMDVDRETLDGRIALRVDEMVASGLVDEVRKLKDQYGCSIPSMSGIGYRELCRFFESEVKLEQAIENIKTNTRRFARRQMTWFKRREEIVWVKDFGEALGQVETFLK